MTTLIEKHLPLLARAQSLIRFGCWEWDTVSRDMLWTEGMFAVFELPETSDNYVRIEDMHKFVHPVDLELVKSMWAEMRAGKATDFRFRVNTLSGDTRYLQFCSETIAGKKGGWLVQGCCRDVTAEKNTLQVLVESREELELQLKAFKRAEQAAKSGTWQIDLNTHETYYSDNTYRLYGLAPQSLPAHLNTFAAYIHPDEKAVVTEMSDLAFRQKLPLHLEYRIIRADGEERFFRVISEVTRGIAGEEKLTGITQDITERKQLELELKETNRQLSIHHKHIRQAEQMGMLGTFQIDLATRECWYSDNFYRIYGLKPSPVPVAADHFTPYLFNEDKERFTEVYRNALAGEPVPELEFRITAQDGKMHCLRQNIQLIRTADEGQRLVGVVRDITDQRLLDQKLTKLKQELLLQHEAFVQGEQAANFGSWRWNLATNDIYYSDNIYRIYGLKPQSIKPGFENFQRYFHPDDLERLKQVPILMQRDRKPVDLEYRIHRADGELRYIRARNKIITTDTGEDVFIGTTMDITEEVMLRNSLEEKKRYVDMLNNHLIDQVVVTDTANSIVEMNKAAETIQGVSKAGVIGRNFFEVFPKAKNEKIIDNLKRALAGELVHDVNITSPLSKSIIERYHIPVMGDDAVVNGVLTVVRDVTEQYRLGSELQQRLNFIEKLVDATVGRVLAVDKDLNFTIWNKAAEKYYGLSRREIIGKNLLEFIPGFKKEPLYEELRKALAGEVVFIAPNENDRDGYHEAYVVPLHDDREEVNGVLWIINDLSERREAEKAMEESRNILLQTAEASPDAIIIYDLVNREPVYLNNQLAEWMDVSCDTLLSMGAEGRLTLVHPEERAALMQFNEDMKYVDEGQLKTIEYRILTRQRRYIWVRHRSKVFKKDAQGNTTHLLAVVQDITEQKATEERLAMEHRRLKEAQFIGHVGSFEWIASTDSSYWSDEMYRIHGLEPQSVPITLATAMSFVHPDDRDNVTDLIFQWRARPGVYSVTNRIIRADGVQRTVIRQVQTFADEQGNITHLSGTVQDITAQAQAEETIQQMLNGSIAAIVFFESVRNDEGRIIDFIYKGGNKAAEQVHGASNEELVGRRLLEQFPAEKDLFFHSYVDVVESGRMLRGQRQFPDESAPSWFDVSAVKNGDGFILTLLDITEHRKAVPVLQQKA